MRTAHILHGFNVRDGGASTTDLLIPYLEAVRIRACQHDYGYFELLKVRLCNGQVADVVKACARRGDIGVGHSNGCAILAEALARGAPLVGLVLINPALDSDWHFAPQLRWVHVYFNREDRAVWFAKLLRFEHPWGAMGREGYFGNDQRVVNIDCYPGGASGHSAIFEQIDKWGSLIVQRVQRALRGTTS